MNRETLSYSCKSKALINRLIWVCRGLHQKALNHDWDAFVKFGKRQARLTGLLQHLFRNNAPDTVTLDMLLEAKASLDAAILLAEHEKKSLLARIREIDLGKKGVSHYHAAERVLLDLK
jgi:hypothetical protein